VSAGTLARRYAKALIEIAAESGQADSFAQELSDLASCWTESGDFRDVFENPAVDSNTRRKVLDALIEKTGTSKTIGDTVRILADRRRLRLLPDLAKAYAQLAQANAGRVQATVTTATAMPDTYFDSLRQALEAVTGKSVVLEKEEDPGLIAGVVARVGDMVFDGSLRNQLQEMKEDLLAR
jgi:F-type H+-transporting ATPase subunit delta